MRVKAEGAGYAGIYTARRERRGWCFIQQDGTYLTPGIGRPMFYPSADELLTACREYSGARIATIPENGDD